MLLKISKRINHRKRVISSALALIIIAGSIAGAVFTAPVAVYALSAGGIKSTIASLIISLLLQTGTAPVNQSYLDALNASYGYTIETAINEGLLTETANGLIDSGLSSAIEGASAYTDLGLDDIFTTTLDDVGVAVASGGVNIANTAIHVGKAGTIGAFAGAIAVGIGAGVLINHVREKIGNYIKYGVPLNLDYIISNNILGGSFYYIVNNYGARVVSYDTNDFVGVRWNGSYRIYNLKTGTFNRNVTRYNTSNQMTSSQDASFNFNQGGSNFSGTYITLGPNNYIEVNSEEDAGTYVNNLINGTVEKPPVISPDVIGPEGNQYYDSENDTFPGLVNQIPEGADMMPVDMDDYQTFADNANSNTENGDTGQEIQGEDFDDLIEPLIVDAPEVPDQPIIPDQPVDVPTVPDRPVIPDQPTIPDKPGITQEQLEQGLQGATTIDLRSIFPFCIPFDLYNLLLIFDTGENRKAPHITFTFPLTDWVIDVDLAPFDPVAGILRLLELILFIIGLAVATRSLIGAGGG